jgi:lipoprotein-anchoring transpeptidase ErfK/SrfK
MFKRFLVLLLLLSLGLGFGGNRIEAAEKEQLLVINKKTNELAFFEDGKLIKTYHVATGKAPSLTPQGTFYIREKIKNRPYYTGKIKGGDPKNPLGDRWLGINYNENGTFPIAIHGNNNEKSIGKYVSAGCIRMHNKDIRELYEKIEVKAKVVITTTNKSLTDIASPHMKLVATSGK